MTPDTPEVPAVPAPLSPDWYRVQLAAAQKVLAERERALAAAATREYGAWREVAGVVNTLAQLVALHETTSEQE